jgi:hypothetical protein
MHYARRLYSTSTGLLAICNPSRALIPNPSCLSMPINCPCLPKSGSPAEMQNPQVWTLKQVISLLILRTSMLTFHLVERLESQLNFQSMPHFTTHNTALPGGRGPVRYMVRCTYILGIFGPLPTGMGTASILQ